MAKKTMAKKDKNKKKVKRNNIILIAFILLAITATIVFNLPEKTTDSDEEKCNVSEGYEWNQDIEECVVYCKPEDRETDMCYQLYEPVCGFTSSGEKETFSNDCFACSNNQIEFYISGECENESKG